jgi:hypothetical protein
VYRDRSDAPAPAKFIIYGLTKTPNPTAQLAPQERRALHHFQHRTKDHIQGPFQSRFWSNVVPTLVENDPIVRQAVVALSDMHEHYLDMGGDGSLQSALHHYQKTLRQLIRLDRPDTSFDTLLAACIILHSFESLRGGFDEATKHAAAGVRMIMDRQQDTGPRQASVVSEQVLSEVFLELHQQVIEANDSDFHAQYPGLNEDMGPVPEAFRNVEEALPFFYRLTYRLLSLFELAEEHYKTYEFIPGLISPLLVPEFDHVRDLYDTWASALSHIESLVKSKDSQQYQGYMVLKCYELSFKIDLEIFKYGEVAYDEFKGENFGILKLIEVLLQAHGDGGSPDSLLSARSGPPAAVFISSLGVISLLFEVATRTNDEQLRQEALSLLQRTNRREGIWDSRVAARLAERILQLKREGAAATNLHFGQKFVVTDIQLLSKDKCRVTYGFKTAVAGSFQSFWLETIAPEEGTLTTEVIDLGTS